jgi:dUTP pyrophosphatase
MQIRIAMEPQWANNQGLVPRKIHNEDAGYDLRAAVREPILLEEGEWVIISAGFRIDLPIGYEAQIRSRSGLVAKHGVLVLNSPGTIDCGYPDVVGVILFNGGDASFTVHPGDRIAQMVICKLPWVELIEVDNIRQKHPRAGGFGSTGVSNGNGNH